MTFYSLFIILFYYSRERWWGEICFGSSTFQTLIWNAGPRETRKLWVTRNPYGLSFMKSDCFSAMNKLLIREAELNQI